MRYHQKEYEDVFSTDQREGVAKLRLEKVSIDGMELEEYTKLFVDSLNEFYTNFFDGCIRFSWLKKKFRYYQMKFEHPMGDNPPLLNLAFVKYVRRYVGKDLQIITRNNTFTKIEPCLEELFPGFMEGNPFENPDYYKFPFKNLSVDYLFVVHQLDDKMSLLKKADEEKMSYSKFADYVINHVKCENAYLDREKYLLKSTFDRHFPFYVTDTDKIDTKKRRKTKRK